MSTQPPWNVGNYMAEPTPGGYRLTPKPDPASSGLLTEEDLLARLRELGYGTGTATAAITQARVAADGVAFLDRHVIAAKPGGFTLAESPTPQLTPAQQIIAEAPQIMDDLLHVIEVVDAWLDVSVAQEYKDQPLAQDWARVAKGDEEKGESIAELILATGQNPRKGTDPAARDRLLAELADRAMTALFGIQHFSKDSSETWRIFTAALEKAAARAAAGGYK